MTEQPSESKDFALVIRRAVMYLLMVVPVESLKILHRYDGLRKKWSARPEIVSSSVKLSLM